MLARSLGSWMITAAGGLWRSIFGWGGHLIPSALTTFNPSHVGNLEIVLGRDKSVGSIRVVTNLWVAVILGCPRTFVHFLFLSSSHCLPLSSSLPPRIKSDHQCYNGTSWWERILQRINMESTREWGSLEKRKQVKLGQGSLNLGAHSSSSGDSSAEGRVRGLLRGGVHLFRGEVPPSGELPMNCVY